MAERTYELTTPLGSNALMFYRMSVSEELSRLGECELEALSENGAVDIDKILGKEVSISAELPAGGKRYFHYFVTRFSQEAMHGRYHVYRATLRPWVWFLTQTSNCRIFQEKTVPEIIKAILDEQSFTNYKIELTETYRKRVYCVQYRESDFNFISRLMEEEGIYYYFRHSDQNCTMVLADSKSAHSPFPNYKELRFIPLEGLIRAEEEHIFRWTLSREVQSGKYTLRDYDFEKPSVDLLVNKEQQRRYDHSKYEVFDYPGEYIQKADGTHYASVRLEELQAQFELANAESDARGICVGYLLNMTRHPRSDQNREYLIVSSQIEMRNNEWESADQAGIEFRCQFSAMSSQEVFRPKRLTRRPFVQGPQTAVVVGPSGDEIYTDKYGRVKVQFFWDRLGKKDQNSSCWMRVSHPWAGKNWGMIAIPRIGQEVIVDFLEGDPDQPIITGRVYNAEQMPPYDLPANMTQTGIKTRSSKGGTGSNFN
ncbi:MAG TPA: type VI secretion system tip protein VgrG, partial [Pseudomonadales bacterium]|nr:type VI secretion system tip protein VgrG [Pseudomonadales bacterium]